jgi:hexosaminidase
MYRRLTAASLRLESLGLTHESNPNLAVRELAPSTDPIALQTFASTLKPYPFSVRYHLEKTSQMTPLVRLEDVLSPDPPQRYLFEAALTKFLHSKQPDSDSQAQLEAILQTWQTAAAEAQIAMSVSPILAEASLRAEQLPLLAAIAEESIHRIGTGTAAPFGWKNQERHKLAQFAEPNVLVQFNMLDQVQRLVDAVPDAQGIVNERSF